jgi:tRNA/rRNA methyltransferase
LAKNSTVSVLFVAEKMKNPYKVFHSTKNALRERIHFILVHPEQGANVGAVARAMANMGIQTPLRIVGTSEILDESSRKLAKHAMMRLTEALFFEDLRAALAHHTGPKNLTIAATARVGSSSRAHPMRAREAVIQALEKLSLNEVSEINFVFGRESDGLTNDEVALCDWIATIPSSPEYRSLNLAQAALIFSYEANMWLLEPWAAFEGARTSQKRRLIRHLMQLADEVGFILPGDPFKMRPRLEGIFSKLPHHIAEASTLHGLIDQAVRSVKKGAPDIKGRYRRWATQEIEKTEVSDGNQSERRAE